MVKHEIRVPFEEALNMTGFGKFNILSFMLCGSIIMGMAFEIFSVAYLVPGSACELQTTSSQQGLMAAVPLIGIIMTSHVWGYLADTLGRRKVLCFSMTMSFIAAALAALSPDWITFSVLKFLSSSAVSGGLALSLTLLSECTPEAKRSLLIILTSSVFLCCNGIMAIITIPVLPMMFSYYVPVLNIQFNSWRLLALIFSLPCALSVFGLWLSLESPKYLLSVEKEADALIVLRKMYTINSNRSGDEYPVKSIWLDEMNGTKTTGFFASIVQQTAPLFKPPLLKSTILLALIFGLVYIMVHPIVVWLPLMADAFMSSVQRGEENLTFCQRMRASQSLIVEEVDTTCALNDFALTLVFGVGVLLAVINTIVSSIINLVGRKNLFIAIQVVAGVCSLSVNFISIWQLSALFIIAVISGIINFGLLTSFSVDVFPTYVKAMAVCLTLMVGRGCAVVGVNLLKYLLDHSCEASFYIIGTVSLLAGLLGLLLPGERKRPSKHTET